VALRASEKEVLEQKDHPKGGGKGAIPPGVSVQNCCTPFQRRYVSISRQFSLKKSSGDIALTADIDLARILKVAGPEFTPPWVGVQQLSGAGLVDIAVGAQTAGVLTTNGDIAIPVYLEPSPDPVTAPGIALPAVTAQFCHFQFLDFLRG
jgi:hypothetical protein